MKNIKNECMVVGKIWGSETWLVNDQYCCKELFLKKGYRCSLHHHKVKDEVFYIISGSVLIELEENKKLLKPGDWCRVAPGQSHRFTGVEDSLIIESSTHHEDSDSYRTEKSGKVDLDGCPYCS